MPVANHAGHTGAAGGGGHARKTDNWGTAPAVGSAGDIWAVGNAPLILVSNGTDWTTANPDYDPMGLHYFYDKGYLTVNMTNVINGSRTIPAANETITVAGGSWAISSDGAEGRLTWGATTGAQVAAWTIPSAQRVLIVANSAYAGNTGAAGGTGLFVQNAALAGTDIDNAYYGVLGEDAATIYRESAGFTSLVSADEIRHASAGAGSYGHALLYDDATNTIRFFVRSGSGEYFEVLNTTDATFTSMVRAGLRANLVSANVIARFERLMIFSQAA